MNCIERREYETALRVLEGKPDTRRTVGFFWNEKKTYSYVGFVSVFGSSCFMLNPRHIGGGYVDTCLASTGNGIDGRSLSYMPNSFIFGGVDSPIIEMLDGAFARSVKAMELCPTIFNVKNKSFAFIVKKIILGNFNHSASHARKIQTTEIKKPARPGVYCLRQGEFIKVGKSNVDVNQRSKSQCVAGISKAFVLEHKNADWLESKCHDWMRKNMHHERGEWFRCNGKTDAEVFEFANSMLNNKCTSSTE